MQMLTLGNFSVCISNKLVLFGKMKYFQRLSRCFFCINCHPRTLLEDLTIKANQWFLNMRVENSDYLYFSPLGSRQ